MTRNRHNGHHLGQGSAVSVSRIIRSPIMLNRKAMEADGAYEV
jgi:hypothetical protein